MNKKKPCGLDYCPQEEIVGAYASCLACAWENDSDDKSEEEVKGETMSVSIPYGTLRDIANELKNIREILEKQSSDTPQMERICENCGTPRDKCVFCIEEDRMWTPQTDCDNCVESGSYKCTKCDGEMYYKTDTSQTDCDTCKHYKLTCDLFSEICKYEPKADTPQTDYPCNTCANKGDHDGECKNCTVDSAPIKWKTPTHYKPKQMERS